MKHQKIDFEKVKYPAKYNSFYTDKYYDKNTDEWKLVKKSKGELTTKESLGVDTGFSFKTIFNLAIIASFIIVMFIIYFA